MATTSPTSPSDPKKSTKNPGFARPPLRMKIAPGRRRRGALGTLIVLAAICILAIVFTLPKALLDQQKYAFSSECLADHIIAAHATIEGDVCSIQRVGIEKYRTTQMGLRLFTLKTLQNVGNDVRLRNVNDAQYYIGRIAYVQTFKDVFGTSHVTFINIRDIGEVLATDDLPNKILFTSSIISIICFVLLALLGAGFFFWDMDNDKNVLPENK